MNKLTKIFEGKNLRIKETLKEPLFVLNDVCKILDIENPRNVRNRLDDDVVTLDIIEDRLGRKQNTTLINEDGLYDVILDSRKPEAKKFRKWITSEVLPSIRKTGKYEKEITPSQQLLNQAQVLVEIEQQTKDNTNQIKNLEHKVNNQITLNYQEQRKVQKSVARRVYEMFDVDNRPKGFGSLYSEIKDRFGVGSYKDLKRTDLQLAVNYINNWIPKRD